MTSSSRRKESDLGSEKRAFFSPLNFRPILPQARSAIEEAERAEPRDVADTLPCATPLLSRHLPSSLASIFVHAHVDGPPGRLPLCHDRHFVSSRDSTQLEQRHQANYNLPPAASNRGWADQDNRKDTLPKDATGREKETTRQNSEQLRPRRQTTGHAQIIGRAGPLLPRTLDLELSVGREPGSALVLRRASKTFGTCNLVKRETNVTLCTQA